MHTLFEKEVWQSDEEDIETKTIHEYQKTDDKIAYIQGIADNDNISLYERIERIECCTDDFFDPPSRINHRTQDEWLTITGILLIEKTILNRCSNVNIEKDDWDYRLEENYCRQCTAKAALNQSNEFKKYADLLFELTGQAMDFYFSNPNQPTDMQCTNISYILLSVNDLIKYLQYIDKSCWLLPYWIKFGEECTIKFQESSFKNENILVDIYDAV